jgi:hypothetical protein
MGVNISKMNYSLLVAPKKYDPQTEDLTTELYRMRGADVRGYQSGMLACNPWIPLVAV